MRQSPAGSPHRQPARLGWDAGPGCAVARSRRREEPWTTLHRRLQDPSFPPLQVFLPPLPCTKINVRQPGLPCSQFCRVWGGWFFFVCFFFFFGWFLVGLLFFFFFF